MPPVRAPGSTSHAVEDARRSEAFKRMHPRDIAEQLRDVPVLRVREILRQLPDEISAEVIAESPPLVQVQLFESMRLTRLSGILSEMFTDDAADVLGQLPAQRLKEIIDSLDPASAEELSQLISFPEDTAGGIMQTEVLHVKEGQTVGEAIEYLRGQDEFSGDQIAYLYVTDDQHRLRGVLRARDLLFSRPEVRVRDIMLPNVRAVSVHADQEEIANLFQRYHFGALPVVDDYQKLRGVVTADDVLEVIQEEATEDMQRMVGLSGEERIETPWTVAVQNRLPWLIVNLATGIAAGWVVSLYEETIAQYAALAVFLPIIAGQGGNAGTQTLTVIVRGLALGELRLREQRRVLVKELAVGLLTGIACGVAIGALAWGWKGNPGLGLVAAVAMVMNMVAATGAGVVIPLGLRALRIDPALASGIMLTTVTDIVGFLVFLGLASGFAHWALA